MWVTPLEGCCRMLHLKYSDACLLNMPVTDLRTRRDLRKERLTLGAAQPPSTASRKTHENAPRPADAKRDRLLLSPLFPQDRHLPLRPLRSRGGRSRHAQAVLRHSRTPYFSTMPRSIPVNACKSRTLLKHSGILPVMFPAILDA